jgi:hypothetical protein
MSLAAPPWYDSLWLGKYLAAKEVVAQVAPTRLADFVASFAVLRTDAAFVLRRLPALLDASELAEIRQTIRAIPKDQLEMHELRRFGRLIVHDHPRFAALQRSLAEKVSEWAGEPVEPSYNFLSLYTRLGRCEPHLDAPSAKWTLDLCIDQSEPWPIQFSQVVPWPEDRSDLSDDWEAQIKTAHDLRFAPETLLPGDAMLFSGSSQWHYRDPRPAGRKHFCDLLFLHFIPAGTAELVRPANWARLFEIPELAAIPGIEAAT